MKSSSTHLPSLLGTLLFTVGAVTVLGVSVLIGVLILSHLLTGEPIQVRETILIAVTGFEGLLLLGAAFVSIQKFLGRPSADVESSFNISWQQIAAGLILAGVSILLGYLIIRSDTASWLLIPILTLPAVILPIVIMLGLGVRSLPLGPRWRTWNVLGISMTLVPFITFILESLLIVLIILLVIVYIASQPALTAQLERLATQIYQLERDPEAILDLVAPFMLRPGAIAIALLLFAFLVPLIEELLKPLGVWLFSNQISSPSQGFALGALSGAAYALMETLGVSPQSANWATLLLTRLGTDLLHVTTSALMGAAIVYAVRQRRYLRLLGMYLLCVFLHGLWNGMAIVFTFSTLAMSYGKSGPLNGLAIPATIGLVSLAIFLLLLLLFSNRRMKAAQPTPVSEELVP